MGSLRQRVEAVVVDRIAPLMAVEGGRIDVVDVDEGEQRVLVRIDGSHRGGPGRDILLRYLVEPLLKSAIAEIGEVRRVE